MNARIHVMSSHMKQNRGLTTSSPTHLRDKVSFERVTLKQLPGMSGSRYVLLYSKRHSHAHRACHKAAVNACHKTSVNDKWCCMPYNDRTDSKARTSDSKFACLSDFGLSINKSMVEINLSCACSPGLLGPFGKMRTGFWWPGILQIELGLKMQIYCWLTVVSDCTGT